MSALGTSSSNEEKKPDGNELSCFGLINLSLPTPVPYNSSLKAGDKYILMDLGGGTADICFQEVVGEGGVKGIVGGPSTGGPWGSTVIDEEFMRVLEVILPKGWLKEFRENNPRDYLTLRHNFEHAKETFYRRQEKEAIYRAEKRRKRKYHRVDAPDSFARFLDEKVAMDPTLAEKYESFADMAPTLPFEEIKKTAHLKCDDNDDLLLSYKMWEHLFDSKVVEPLCDHLYNCLREMKRDFKYFFLVGGLSASGYVQTVMREKFGRDSEFGLEIIIPKDPLLSVVKGAVLFAKNPECKMCIFSAVHISHKNNKNRHPFPNTSAYLRSGR